MAIISRICSQYCFLNLSPYSFKLGFFFPVQSKNNLLPSKKIRNSSTRIFNSNLLFSNHYMVFFEVVTLNLFILFHYCYKLCDIFVKACNQIKVALFCRCLIFWSTPSIIVAFKTRIHCHGYLIITEVFKFNKLGCEV